MPTPGPGKSLLLERVRAQLDASTRTHRPPCARKRIMPTLGESVQGVLKPLGHSSRRVFERLEGPTRTERPPKAPKRVMPFMYDCALVAAWGSTKVMKAKPRDWLEFLSRMTWTAQAPDQQIIFTSHQSVITTHHLHSQFHRRSS
jgi:hypothetical protein